MKTSLESMCLNIVDCEHKTSPIDETGEFFAVGTPAMRGNVIDFGQARRISEDTFNKWTRRLRPKFGDLLFAREAPVGPVVLIPQEENVAAGQRTVLLRPDPEQLNSRFLYYFLSSPIQQRKIEALAAGSTVAHLNVADVRSLEMQVPILSDQQAIADVLGALDDKIKANVEIARTADSLASALAQKSFNDSITVALEDIAVITMGSSPKGETLNEAQEGFVFYQGIRDFGLRHPDQRVWTTSPIRMAQTLDTLLSVRAPVGSVNIAQEALCIGRGLASIRSKQDFPYSLFHAVKNSPIWQQYNAEGTVFGTINRKELSAGQVSWAATEQLVELEDSLKPLEELISRTIEASKTLAETRDILLPQLISGKLRVKAAGALVESMM